jgi:predicted MFS family arabinose efflux permease
MGLANIFRICGVLYILFAAGLFMGAIIFSESYFDETDTDDHIKQVKQMALIISSLGVGTGILFLLSSLIKDVNSSKIVLLGVTVSSLVLLTSLVVNQGVYSESPPIPVWIMIVLTFVLSLYGRFKVNRI